MTHVGHELGLGRTRQLELLGALTDLPLKLGIVSLQRPYPEPVETVPGRHEGEEKADHGRRGAPPRRKDLELKTGFVTDRTGLRDGAHMEIIAAVAYGGKLAAGGGVGGDPAIINAINAGFQPEGRPERVFRRGKLKENRARRIGQGLADGFQGVLFRLARESQQQWSAGLGRHGTVRDHMPQQTLVATDPKDRATPRVCFGQKGGG